MIAVADREYGCIPRLKFLSESVEELSKKCTYQGFDIAVSNMSLITMPNLDEAVKAINSLILPGGLFVLNITHPCFYNQYRKYQSDKNFEYHVSHAQKGQFMISNDSSGLPSQTTHYHRPLSEYFRSLRDASFIIDALVEPFPNKCSERLFSKPWKVPHFLSLRCIKARAMCDST